MPELAGQFPTHEAFARATVREILKDRFEGAKIVEVTELRSGIFLNRGSQFDWMPLPREAQLAPVLSMNVGDFDADGVEDLFLSQNFFGTALSELSRDDNGRGLWLRGKGRGAFVPMDPSVSGITIYGEQRGAALADFNHDGRVDVCVSQNNGPTKLYVNQGAKRGLRVTLRGPVENPDAVGAQMCVIYADGREGPCRNIQSGSGYWSQDAAAQVLGFHDQPVGLKLRWPGGKVQTLGLENNAREMNAVFQK